MRLLVLVLNILVGVSLLTHSDDNLATSMSGEASRSFVRSQEKTKKSRTHRRNRLRNTGNVWERIRLGMQLPIPAPVPTSVLTEQILALHLTENKTPTNSNAKDMVIRAGYHKPESKEPRKAETTPLTGNASITQAKDDNLINNQSVQSRVHIRLDLRVLDTNIPQQTATPSSIMISNARHDSPAASTLVELDPAVLEKQRQLQAKQQEELEKQRELERQQLIKRAVIYERVNKHVMNYSNHRDYLYQVAERARPYLYHIVDKLQQNKLPFDLALLPIVESAYQATAQSPKSAAGLWQFIPSTAQDFNLQQSDQYDDRLDIMASTQAAVRYLAFLNRHFKGDWLLALAAYNCGLGAVDNAIKNNLAQGRETDYWSLDLPAETQDYVPRLLALSSIFANPANYQLKLAPIRNEPYFVTVKIDKETDMKYLAEKDMSEIAQLADLSYVQFNQLNPGYLRQTLASNGPFTFLMPAANANLLNQRLAVIAKFTEEPTPAIAPFKTGVGVVSEARKLLFYNAMTASTLAAKLANPFISLNINNSKTTPRITTYATNGIA